MASLKIGILGGTFNPIHKGHITLAKRAKAAADLDRVIFIPSNISYMKDQSEILPAYVRYDLVKGSIESEPAFMVSDMEIRRGGESYTFETIRALNDLYPDDMLYFIVGADTIFSMEKWQHPEVIFQNAHILAASRKDFESDALQEKITELIDRFGADITIFSTENIDISSTMIRDALRNDHNAEELLPEAVIQYLKDHHHAY
ncbi:MAG: nicotinate-nucleotide adenylyltransferase [Lachnospiraceae bacterium]|nr:nicotinate-nucleotide adenylyltransferase [Lachnospiraceae bacterium]